MNHRVAAEMVVPDKGLATPFMVTNKWSLPRVPAQVRVQLPGLVVSGAAAGEGADEPPRERLGRRGGALACCNECIGDSQEIGRAHV